MLASTQFGISESFSKSNIRPVCHTREINCICHFELDQKHYLATGGEDTVIKIWAIQDGKKKLVQVLKSHISNVKSIHVFKDHARTYMISAGGRAQLKVWRLAHLQDDNRFCASEAGSHMLKGRDKKRQKCWRDHDLIDDTETRYMSVQGQFQLDNNKVIVIVTACSDGVLRIINFDIATRHFNLVHEGQVQSHAILKVLVHEELGMITANTIGQLTLWDSNCDDKVKQINLVHQSGINVFSLNSNDQLLVSGGDDCALTVSDLNQSLIVARKPDAHAAQVTGVHFLNNDHFVSCSVDQRLSLWKIFNDASEIQHVAQVFSHVPDIQDMAVWRDDHNKTYACLVGNGLEIFIL
jgi:WD40 repeat protein